MQELLVPRIRVTWPAGVVIAVVTTLGIAVSVALAWLFYTHVEHRFLASSRQQSSVRGAPGEVVHGA
jgi:peptidoglycan/LPS O-acetylase OafA/YrhL